MLSMGTLIASLSATLRADTWGYQATCMLIGCIFHTQCRSDVYHRQLGKNLMRDYLY